MKYLKQFCIILIICFAGDLLHTYLNIPIPGNVMGMLLLLFCLYTGIIKLSMIEDMSKFLLDHLAIFFIPSAVGIVAYFAILEGKWLALISISFISTIIIAAITGLTVQVLMRRGTNE